MYRHMHRQNSPPPMFHRFYRKRVKIFDNNFNHCLHRNPNGKKENDLWIFDNIAASCCKTFVVFKLDSFLTSMGPKLTSLGPMSLELHVTSLRPPMISLILPAPVTYLRTQVTFLRPKLTPPRPQLTSVRLQVASLSPRVHWLSSHSESKVSAKQ